MTGVFRNAPALLAVGLLVCAVTSARAWSPNPFLQYSAGLFVTNNLRLSFQKAWGDGALPGGDVATVSPTLLPLSVSSFRTVSNPVLPKRLAAGVPGLDEEKRHKLELSLLELLQKYELMMDHSDDRALKNNLAVAFNFFFQAAYGALKDGQALTPAQQRSVLPQVNAAIAMALQRQRLSDQQKQEVYESAVLAGSLILGLTDQGNAQNQPEKAKLARDMARELLAQLMGLTPEKVHVERDRVWFE